MKRAWTEAEDQKLIEAVRADGDKWKPQLATLLGRTPLDVKHRSFELIRAGLLPPSERGTVRRHNHAGGHE